jgi:serine/threonine protein kinase
MPPGFEKYMVLTNSTGALLGRGSYGFVQLVRNRETGRLFALKTIDKLRIGTEAGLKAVRREIELHSGITHDHIIRLHEWTEDQTKLYLILEYASRGSLFQKLRKEKKFREDKARQYLC